jgi:hypothetical protein
VRYSTNSRLFVAIMVLVLFQLNGSCMKSGMSHPQGSKHEPGYEILSGAQADELFRTIKSRNADIDTVQKFFLSNSFYLKSVQALTQGSRVACIVLFSATRDDERIGILAIKVQGDAVVETIAGLLWLEPGSGFANEIEGPKLKSTSATSLCGWWSCVFSSVGLSCESKCVGPRRPYNAADRVACLESSCEFPMVYYWFKRCY